MSKITKFGDVLTLEEAARYLRLPRKTVRQLAEDRMIQCRKVENGWRFLKSALDDWLRGKPASGRAALLEQFGAFKDDEMLPKIVAEAYAARRRSAADNGSES